jgi:DNA-directed RNA polymerase specialized sigma24 family protein
VSSDGRDGAASRSPGGIFPVTQWSVFCGLGSTDEHARRAACETLTLLYWKPVWAFIRSTTRVSPEEAGDLTQDFFLWILETGFLSRADPNKGRFRGFVKTALQNYLAMTSRKERALKRGGGMRPLPLDEAPEEELVDGTGGSDPDKLLDRQWTAELLARALKRVRETYEEEGKPTHFAVFWEYYLAASDDLDYRAAAVKFDLSVKDVGNYLRNAKQRFRGILFAMVTETVTSPEELAAEWRDLFGEGDSP